MGQRPVDLPGHTVARTTACTLSSTVVRTGNASTAPAQPPGSACAPKDTAESNAMWCLICAITSVVAVMGAVTLVSALARLGTRLLYRAINIEQTAQWHPIAANTRGTCRAVATAAVAAGVARAGTAIEVQVVRVRRTAASTLDKSAVDPMAAARTARVRAEMGTADRAATHM